jgi:hypothetical protein
LGEGKGCICDLDVLLTGRGSSVSEYSL